MTRISRDQRRQGTKVCLSSRDELILRGVARFRLARTSDILKLAFPNTRQDTAARRLRRLYDVGYLDVLSGDRSQENRYSLGPKGRLWAQDHSVEALKRPSGSLDHHLAIVRVWANLTRYTHDQHIRLDLFKPDWEIRKKASDLSLVPDALVQLTLSGKVLRFAVEVDLGTEPLRTLRDKVTAYEIRRTTGWFGWPSFGLGFVLAGAGIQRCKSIGEVIGASWNGWHLIWNEDEDIPLRTPLAARGVN